MHYHLETIAKETGRIEYVRDDHHYNRLARITGIARKRSLDPDYNSPFSDRHYHRGGLPILPIDCFIDVKRNSNGSETDIHPFRAPSPPDDPDEYFEDRRTEYQEALEEFENSPEYYDGKGSPGDLGGIWNGQQWYPEVMVEKNTAKAYIEDALKDKGIKCFDNGGYTSTPFLYENCLRIHEKLDANPDLKAIIYYVGDADKPGKCMDELLKYDMFHLYKLPGDRVEFKRIAVTAEQIKNFNASTIEIEAFLTPKNIKKFEKLLQDAVDEKWDKKIYDKNVKKASKVESYTDEEIRQFKEEMGRKVNEELGYN